MTLRSALLNRRLDGERFFQAPGLLGGGDGIDEVAVCRDGAGARATGST